MGLIMYDSNEHVENNCTKCRYFTSYRDSYEDELEPIDMGFCSKDMHDNTVNATLTCEFFDLTK